jgi:hypothetical protein
MGKPMSLPGAARDRCRADRKWPGCNRPKPDSGRRPRSSPSPPSPCTKRREGPPVPSRQRYGSEKCRPRHSTTNRSRRGRSVCIGYSYSFIWLLKSKLTGRRESSLGSISDRRSSSSWPRITATLRLFFSTCHPQLSGVACRSEDERLTQITFGNNAS